MPEASTPLMRQYNSIKQKYPQALLFFRLGDFYELFFEDAILAARELQITLTSRNKEKGVAVPMCGVPQRPAAPPAPGTTAGPQGKATRALPDG